MAGYIDPKSKQLLRPHRPLEHVEREQKIVNKELAEDLPPAEPEKELGQEDQFVVIQSRARKVKAAAIEVEKHLAAKLKDYTVSDPTNDELLDAEERLFGTRTGVITYQMYRVCLGIVGKQASDFAGKAAVTPDSILQSVGGNLKNAFTPDGIANFMKTNSLLKDGKMDFSKYAPFNAPDMKNVQTDAVKKLWDMIVDIALPGPLKKLIGAD